MAAPNTVTLAPCRRQAAVAATRQWAPLCLVAGVLAGYWVAGVTHERSTPSHHVTGLATGAISAGIATAVVLYALVLWRASTMRLVVDKAHGVLEVHNFWRTTKVSAHDVADLDLTLETVARSRYSSVRVPCVTVHTRNATGLTGQRIFVQASLGNGDDHTIEDALTAFCADHGVTCDFTEVQSTRWGLGTWRRDATA